MQSPAPALNKLDWKRALALVAGAAAAFHLAYIFSMLSFLIAVYVWCLFQLTNLPTPRQSFYFGLAAGFLCVAPQAGFFWTIFNGAAVALWMILAFWIALFVLLGNLARKRFGQFGAAAIIPFLWTGLEYFRSELYYLRFSWLNVGYVFANNAQTFPVRFTGVYGIGFVLMAVIALMSLLARRKRLITSGILLAFFAILTNFPGWQKHFPSVAPSQSADSRSARPGQIVLADKAVRAPVALAKADACVQVAGVQMEFPSDAQVILALDKLVKEYPNAQLLVLSEYTFTAPVPDRVKEWCRKERRYLVVGAEDPATNGNYYDTAFVVGPAGEIVFGQGKSVPIQFFKDGLPAKEQKLWDSPWGKIGFCVCYDLSYSRVTDGLIRLGAQAIIVPTMDVVDWGRHQHELHARVAPTRAIEYGVPIFRLASSGISQFVDGAGRVLATAPVPGEEALLSAPLQLGARGRLPWDRIVAPGAVVITGFAICWLSVCSLRKGKNQT